MQLQQQSLVLALGQKTDAGKVRLSNEDAIGATEISGALLLLLCDGMGGHVGGLRAAELAIATIKDYFKHAPADLMEFELLSEAFALANRAIILDSLENRQFSGMGTTCVVCLVKAGKAYYAHVGDSRLYHYRNSILTQLTTDHSFVQMLVEEGSISPEQAAVHPRRNEITRSLGSDASMPSIAPLPLSLRMGDSLLLCSDGLTNMLNDKQIADILRTGLSAGRKADKLVELANAAGGLDNVSVQVLVVN